MGNISRQGKRSAVTLQQHPGVQAVTAPCGATAKPAGVGTVLTPGAGGMGSSWRYPLFHHMQDAHGLTLTESELHEIERVVLQMVIEAESAPRRVPVVAGSSPDPFPGQRMSITASMRRARARAIVAREGGFHGRQ